MRGGYSTVWKFINSILIFNPLKCTIFIFEYIMRIVDEAKSKHIECKNPLQDLKIDAKFFRDAWALLKPYW